MRKIINFTFAAFVVAFIFATCKPQEFDDFHLESDSDYSIGEDMITFIMIPSSTNLWTYDYAITIDMDPTKHPYLYEIRFGDGTNVVKNLSGTHKYIVYAGTYVAEITVYTPNGVITKKSVSITFTNDNPEVYQDDPASPQFALTGGKANTAGKEWRMKSGSGLGPIDGKEIWWNLNNEPALFDDDVFIFQPNGVEQNGKYAYSNNGSTFMNESLASLFPDSDPTGSFVTYHYTPPTDATWSIESRNDKYLLIINKGFIGYPVTVNDLNLTEYEILSFSPSEIRLKYYSPDGNAWFFNLASEVPSNPLTGDGSKVWVIDGYNKHTTEVATATGLNIKGFMGLGPLNSYGQEWWSAGAGDKSFETAQWTLYDWKIEFSSPATLKITTAGAGYGRKSFNGQPFTATSLDGDDMTFPFDGGNYTYSIKDGDNKYQILTLSGNAFMGYYCGTQDYEILYLSDEAMALCVHNTTEGQDWVFVYTVDGKQ
jgi:hypothetical protein